MSSIGSFFGNLEEASAGFLRKALQDFLAVRVGLLRIAAAATTTTGITTARITATAHAAAMAAPGSAAAHVRASEAIVVGVFVGEEDGVDERVGALRGFDGAIEADLAASIDAVGEDDDGLASLLLLQDFVRAEEDCVVKNGAGVVLVSLAGIGRAGSLVLGIRRFEFVERR